MLVSQSKEAFDLKKGSSVPIKEVEMVEEAVFMGTADKQSYGPFRPTTTNTTKHTNPNTTSKNPFSVARDNSQSSVFTRYTASQRASSANCRRIRMRISDIHFREVNADDITYLMGNDGDFKPQVYHD